MAGPETVLPPQQDRKPGAIVTLASRLEVTDAVLRALRAAMGLPLGHACLSRGHHRLFLAGARHGLHQHGFTLPSMGGADSTLWMSEQRTQTSSWGFSS
jgi:hypothetical protein